MNLYSENDNYKLFQGNMLDMLEVIEPETIDSIVTDPPYELNFMGKGWDNAGVSFQPDTWKKCFDVLKPGGYLLAFGGSRTFHRIACAIEDAGFEIRDTIMWLYGSGFPKSMNLGLAIDKKNGVESKIVGKGKSGISSRAYQSEETTTAGSYEIKEAQNKWNGWGTALKPSFEPIIVARKPIDGTVAKNCLKWGVGGINIDECRVESNGEIMSRPFNNIKDNTVFNKNNSGYKKLGNPNNISDKLGRFPANTIFTYDETDFDEVCGGFPNTKSQKTNSKLLDIRGNNYNNANKNLDVAYERGYTDSGSASRYFMNCKYTGKDEEIWKQLLVNNVENNLEILKATKDNIAQMNVEDLLKELKDHYAKYVGNQLDLIETSIVQDIVEMLTWDFKIGTSQVIQDFITNSKKCTQFLNLVQFVEKMDNIDTTQITQNLLKLFGYVKVVITNYIQGNIEYDQKRYIYTPKASKKDRDEGLEEFEAKPLTLTENKGRTFNDRCAICGKKFIGPQESICHCENPVTDKTKSAPRKNVHPTVKPCDLMQYLVRLVTPNNGTILDPFNGSGSTGKAVMYENKERSKNYKYIGIEITEEYLPISKARIEYVYNLEEEKDNQTNIFDFIEENNNV